MKQVRKVPKQVIVAEFITGQADMQRQRWVAKASDIAEKAELIAKSAAKFNLSVYVLTNEELDYQSHNLTVIQQLVPEEFENLQMYFKRWMMAYRFLIAHPEIEEVFFVDLGDVEVLHNPFNNLEKDYLYFSDENEYLNANIVSGMAVPEYVNLFFKNNWYLKLLDPGIIGGKREIVLEYLGILNNLMADTFLGIKKGITQGLGAFEMAIINYTAYQYFSNRIKYGRQVSTIVFQNRSNDFSWFKHK